MGSLFGGGSAAKAAKRQAEATEKAARDAARQANFQAEAAAQSMTLAQEQRKATAAAEDLLSTPMENATVDLAQSPDEGEDDDLLTRRKTTRQKYQAPRTGLAV